MNFLLLKNQKKKCLKNKLLELLIAIRILNIISLTTLTQILKKILTLFLIYTKKIHQVIKFTQMNKLKIFKTIIFLILTSLVSILMIHTRKIDKYKHNKIH
jgi:hypothetical protein